MDIIKRLEKTFGDLHEALGDKRFRRRIKKAGKLLADNLKTQPAIKQKASPAKTASSENAPENAAVDNPVK